MQFLDSKILYINRILKMEDYTMGDPIGIINIGGVRFYQESVIEQSKSYDEQGNEIFNVTLAGGTKLSYPYQKENSMDCDIEFWGGEKNGDNKKPFVMETSFYHNANSISIFGLENATIKGNENTSELINMYCCQNNKLYFNDGDNRDIVDTKNNDSRFGCKNNTIYIDEFDMANHINGKDGNYIIKDE